jgi:hypothetical protein
VQLRKRKQNPASWENGNETQEWSMIMKWVSPQGKDCKRRKGLSGRLKI